MRSRRAQGSAPAAIAGGVAEPAPAARALDGRRSGRRCSISGRTASASAGFFGGFVADHPEATSIRGSRSRARVLALPKRTLAGFQPTAARGGKSKAPTLFSAAPLLESRRSRRRCAARAFPERAGGTRSATSAARCLSFFHGADSHVVLRAKELRVLRPHGHLLRTRPPLTPDETALTSTAWMSGVFHSMVTQGHVSINRFLSTVHSYLALFRSHGQRVFVQLDGQWHLLDMPSAFEMSPDALPLDLPTRRRRDPGSSRGAQRPARADALHRGDAGHAGALPRSRITWR